MAHDSTFYELTLKLGRILMGHPDTLPKNGGPMRLPIGALERGFVSISSLVRQKGGFIHGNAENPQDAEPHRYTRGGGMMPLSIPALQTINGLIF